jgi:hypothetical protein
VTGHKRISVKIKVINLNWIILNFFFIGLFAGTLGLSRKETFPLVYVWRCRIPRDIQHRSYINTRAERIVILRTLWLAYATLIDTRLTVLQ